MEGPGQVRALGNPCCTGRAHRDTGQCCARCLYSTSGPSTQTTPETLLWLRAAYLSCACLLWPFTLGVHRLGFAVQPHGVMSHAGPADPAAGPRPPLPAPASATGHPAPLSPSAPGPGAALALWQGLPALPALQLLRGQRHRGRCCL